jgi:predicted transcriptional regulator
LAKAQNPLQADIPDYLKDDPAFKYMNERFNPYVQSLEQKLRALEQKTSKIDEYEKQTQEAQYKQHLDSQLDSAKGRIKAMFGREATEEEVTQVLEYMVENKFYNNGAAAAVAVFQDQYEKVVQERFQKEMSEKAKKFPPRNKSVNSARAQTSKEALSVEEAIKMAMEEQGYQ